MNKLSEKENEFKKFTIDPNLQRKSLRDVHNYETIGHTKKDRAFSILFYRICYSIYFFFLICFGILLFLVDIIPATSN
jgi:hypothetical protein